MTEASPTTETKKRGVGFPVMSLQDAVDAVVLAGQHGPDHTNDAFATYLGHQTANSGAFRGKLASLRDWGLIARGDRDRVTLSGLAQDLVLAVPDHYEAKHLLLTAFESCRVFGMLYNDSAKGVPIDISRLRATVLMRYGVAPEQADRFVDSFIKSAVFAGLADSDGAKVRLNSRDSAFGGSANPDEGVDDDALGSVSANALPPSVIVGKATVPSPVIAADVIPTALRQAWPIDGGEIEFVIRTPKAMPPKIYALMAEMAETAEKMADLLRPEPQPEPSPAAPSMHVGDGHGDEQGRD